MGAQNHVYSFAFWAPGRGVHVVSSFFPLIFGGSPRLLLARPVRDGVRPARCHGVKTVDGRAKRDEHEYHADIALNFIITKGEKKNKEDERTAHEAGANYSKLACR